MLSRDAERRGAVVPHACAEDLFPHQPHFPQALLPAPPEGHVPGLAEEPAPAAGPRFVPVDVTALPQPRGAAGQQPQHATYVYARGHWGCPLLSLPCPSACASTSSMIESSSVTAGV